MIENLYKPFNERDIFENISKVQMFDIKIIIYYYWSQYSHTALQ